MKRNHVKTRPRQGASGGFSYLAGRGLCSRRSRPRFCLDPVSWLDSYLLVLLLCYIPGKWVVEPHMYQVQTSSSSIAATAVCILCMEVYSIYYPVCMEYTRYGVSVYRYENDCSTTTLHYLVDLVYTRKASVSFVALNFRRSHCQSHGQVSH